MNNQPSFKHILIINSVTKRYQGLARVLRECLQEPKISFLNSVTDSLPGSRFDWADIDLMMIDLSKHISPIYHWYLNGEHHDRMIPAIFMAHPASVNDAGHFYRAGAADYLELRGLERAQLIRSLAITSSLTDKNKVVKANEITQPSSTAGPVASKNNEERAEFLNTGLMSILDRHAVKELSNVTA